MNTIKDVMLHIAIALIVFGVLTAIVLIVGSNAYYEALNCSKENLTQCTMNITEALSTY